MAEISRLSRLIDGLHRNVDLSTNTLVVSDIKVGGSASGTILSKAILDKLVLMQGVADADGSYDSRYRTQTELASTANGEGASLIGLESIAGMSAANVQAAIAELKGLVDSGTDDQTAAEVSYSNATSGLTATDVQAAIDEVEGRVDTNETNISAKIDSSEKGAANGVATLNASGKLAAAQVPAIAISETFVVADIAARDALTVGSADGEVQKGDVSIVTDASADVDVDSGAASYIYDGAAWQLLKTPASPVQSVNGQTGVVVLGSDDVAEGASNLYYTEARFDSSLAGKSTTDVAEGTNLYYTEARFDSSLAGKSAADLAFSNATSGMAASDVQAAIDEVEGRVDTLEAIPHDIIKKSFVAGEAMAANTTFMLRMAVSGETAGRVYLADNDASANDNFYVMGLVSTSAAVSAGDSIEVVLLGEIALGSANTAFGAADVGKPVYLDASGAFSVTAPTVADSAVVRVGIAQEASKILVQGIQVNGVN